ncbi:carbon-nitrogen hydrolase family protein [Tengunoibacter tsumagoiensis]|uniref:Carbon-nitrogen hydrolase n=1 Tax=Tengunoibacter tsumagoiensis TaxID=2014871 RepID=A0A402A107_9CHLR|nr:carbon-nitrogen hydrolase family protein [Tengunoibacter tsumagoiensis]GCE12827.1 carbon-nitrogen hydrolase [Tengunoibacter tsumagoiensis]
MQINIAVVQFSISQFAPATNLRKAEAFIQQAAGQANVIIFPEDVVTGPLSRAIAYADSEQRYVRHFQELARTYQIDIVPGSIIEEEAGKFYNTTYYIEKTGEILGRYRKVNLWLSERSYLTPGHDFPVFETPYGKAALLICWDLIFPEAFRALTRQGVELVYCPSYWCFEDAGVGLKHDANAEIHLVDALSVARAFENGIIFVYANAAASATGTDQLIGHSQITVPFKGIVQRFAHSNEDMFIQSVETSLLADAERAYEIRQDLATRLLEPLC